MEECNKTYSSCVECKDAPCEITMPVLKECPFCGGKAYLFVEDGVRVRCGSCGASTVTLIDSWSGNHTSGNATKRVIEKWNKRVN